MTLLGENRVMKSTLRLVALLALLAGCVDTLDKMPPLEKLPIWYLDLAEYKETHPGEYVVGVGSDTFDEAKAWNAADHHARSLVVPQGRDIALESFLVLDESGRRIPTWDSVVGPRKVIALYRLK